jgi:hypothetical protein
VCFMHSVATVAPGELTPGEAPLQVTTKNLRISIRVDYGEGFKGAVFGVPNSEDAMTLPPQGLAPYFEGVQNRGVLQVRPPPYLGVWPFAGFVCRTASVGA